MRILKQILNYLVWVIIAFLLSIVYLRILLGPRHENSTGIWQLFNILYDFALLHLGFIIGSSIAFLFILMDVLYLKKKLKNNRKAIGIRFLIMITIAFVLGFTHYFLEKVIDVI